MIRNPTMKEAVELGAVLVVECDRCGAVQDALSETWAARAKAGELYAGEVLCWRCVKDGRDVVSTEGKAASQHQRDAGSTPATSTI